MSEFEFESDRHFQMWKYGVSHAQLLLRSVKGAAHSTRIDVLFVNVKRLDLPTSLNGLRIERADDEVVVRRGLQGESVKRQALRPLNHHGESVQSLMHAGSPA